MAGSWKDFTSKEYDELNNKYLPARGEGDNMATQAITAINRIIYRFFNDGDIYDNTYYMKGYAGYLCNPANWLYKYIPETRFTLNDIDSVFNDDEYISILKKLAKIVFNKELLEELENKPAENSIYTCTGPFNNQDSDDEDFED